MPSTARIVRELTDKDQLAEYVKVGSSSEGPPSEIVKFNNEGNYIRVYDKFPI